MSWLPADSGAETNVAVPSGCNGSTAVPSPENVTVPVGVPVPGAFTVTVAVNVTDCPATDGLSDDDTVVVVEATGLTPSGTGPALLPSKFESPL